MSEYHRTMADRSPAPAALSSDAEPSRWHWPHLPGTSTFSRRRLSTGFKHLVGDTKTTFSSFMARWKTFFVFCLVESRPATHEFWRLCRNALDENSDENAPGKRYMLRA
ncbi:hypothetical protein QWA68_002091, partial [Fusarium oxysporum]